MNVCLCSAFRNASGYIDRYAHQVRGLAELLYQRDDELNLIWCEGDSADDTAAKLIEADELDIVCRAYSIEIFECSHDGPEFGPIVNAQRFRQLASVWNAIWRRIPANTDIVLFVESDLIWDADTMLRLIDHVRGRVAVAPMIMDGPSSFYDTFAYRKNGVGFSKAPPYHEWLTGDMMQVDSAGSALAIDGELARQLVWPETDVVVGLCRQIYESGGSVWLDPNLVVRHP